MNATYESMLLERALSDERILVLTAENRAVIRSLPAALGERFVDFGICEQTMIGAAAGLALRGRIPVAHALAAFLTMRPFEFIRTDVGIPGLPVKLVGGVPGLLSEANGPTHQALEDVALLRGIPGMSVYCPGDEDDLLLALPSFLDCPGPAYLRYNGRKAVVAHEAFVPGRAEVLRPGSEVAILTYGTLLTECAGAARLLSERGIDARLVNLRTLEPFDEEAVLSAARETGLLVTVEDHFRRGGLATAVAETLVRARVPARTHAIAFEARWFRPGLLPAVLEHERLTPAHLANRIEQELRIS